MRKISDKELREAEFIYLEDGDEVTYDGQTEDYYVVRHIYERDDGSYYGDPFLVKEVYLETPVTKRHEKIEALDKEITEKQNNLYKIRDDIRAAEKEQKDLVSKLSRTPALKNIADFIEDKITHFVHIHEYTGVSSIETKEEALKVDSQYDTGKRKLLTLYGKTNGDLQWQIHQYSDGSSSNRKLCYPFLSEEEAIAFTKNHIKNQIENTIATIEEGKHPNYAPNIVEVAVKYDVPVPEKITDYIKNIRLKRFTDQKEKCELELAKINEELSEIS